MRLLALLFLLPAFVHAQLVPGVLRESSYEAPPESGAGDWSFVALGTGVCTSVTDSAGTLTIEASGPDIDNGCLVYQTVSADEPGDGAQVYGRIASITGTASATTTTSAVIKNSTATDSAACRARWRNDITATRGNYTAADGQTSTGGITGNATSVPLHLGVAFTDAANTCELFEYDTATAPADPTSDFTGIPQPHQSYPSDMSTSFIVGFWVQSGHASNTATVTITDYEVQDVLDLADSGGAVDPDEGLIYRADFESGAIQAKATTPDGFVRNTMDAKCDDASVACPDPASPPRCYTTQSCPGTHAYSDTVVTSDNGVTPRAGNYMVRYETRTADYPIGNPPGTTNERSQLQVDPNTSAYHCNYNETCWVGFSAYFPSTEYAPTYSDTWAQISMEPEPSCSGCSFHITYIQYRPQNAGDTTPTSFRARCNYYLNSSSMNICTSTTTGVGYKNPFDAYLDEWIDFRIEFKAHDTNGVYKVWTRRAEITNTWTLEVDYSGPLGWFDTSRTYLLDIQLYGGGGFPLVKYVDEIKIATEVSGVMTDVDPPDIAP